MGATDPDQAFGWVKETLESPHASFSIRPADHTRRVTWTEQSPAVQNALQMLEPERWGPEQHRADDEAHCINPKCGYRFTPGDEQQMVSNGGEFECPNCHFVYNYLSDQGQEPGGYTRAIALSVMELGQIGEQLIFRMGELPGYGSITPASSDYNFPIDAIVRGNAGDYGCEIKTNHSEAQPRFKIGGQKERADKITYCYANGLKPALIGVRLNFFNNKAYVFFREGLTDTWIGISHLQHVATVNFEDLNPFKSPDPSSQAMAVEQAQIPDQSEVDEFAGVFGHKRAFNPAHDEAGKFTFREDVHKMNIKDTKGKHTHTAFHCLHCGHLIYKPTEHRGRVECPTCGEDPERKLHAAAKITLSFPSGADDAAQELGWTFAGYTTKGHRRYTYQDENSGNHMVISDGAHVNRDDMRARGRMIRCMNGDCMHGATPGPLPEVVEPGLPMFRAGDTVTFNGTAQVIADIEGNIALIQDLNSGQEEMVYLQQLQRASSDIQRSEPDWLFIYYLGELRIERYDHNLSYERMFESLLKEYGLDSNDLQFVDPTKVASGEVYTYADSVRFEHKQLVEPEVKEAAEEAVRDWLNDDEKTLEPESYDGDEASEHKDEEEPVVVNETWRYQPRDDDGTWLER